MRACVVGVALGMVAALCACDTPHTYVVLANHYPPSSGLVIYAGAWQALTWSSPISPGASSKQPGAVLAASGNTAYVVLAQGWDEASSTPPTSLVVLESQSDFASSFDTTLDIPVDDASFRGNCAAQSFLSQADADFITQRIFPGVFAGLAYDPTTCTTTPVTDSGF